MWDVGNQNYKMNNQQTEVLAQQPNYSLNNRNAFSQNSGGWNCGKGYNDDR